jgi:hypothetical protein
MRKPQTRDNNITTTSRTAKSFGKCKPSKPPAPTTTKSKTASYASLLAWVDDAENECEGREQEAASGVLGEGAKETGEEQYERVPSERGGGTSGGKDGHLL